MIHYYIWRCWGLFVRRDNNDDNFKPEDFETKEQKRARLHAEYEVQKRLTIWLMDEFKKQGITHKEHYFIDGEWRIFDTGRIPRVPIPHDYSMDIR